MNYLVKGRLVSYVPFHEKEEHDREIFNSLLTKQVQEVILEIETVEHMMLKLYNLEIKLDENLDGSIDDWHGSARFESDVEVVVDTESEQESLDVMNTFYNRQFEIDRLHVIVSNEGVFELDTIDSSYIIWDMVDKCEELDVTIDVRRHLQLLC